MKHKALQPLPTERRFRRNVDATSPSRSSDPCHTNWIANSGIQPPPNHLKTAALIVAAVAVWVTVGALAARAFDTTIYDYPQQTTETK